MSKKGTASSKKLKSAQPKEEMKPTWRQEYSDFVIELGSGKELKCYKVYLAENSSMLDTMLKSRLAEEQIKKMKVDHFDDVTVFHFLEYIYSSHEHTHTCSVHAQPFYKRIYQKEKFTIEQMKMAHMTTQTCKTPIWVMDRIIPTDMPH